MGCKRAQVCCLLVSNGAQKYTDLFLAGKPLRCQWRPMMVSIGMTPEGWGLRVFTALANQSCCTKRTQKQTQDLKWSLHQLPKLPGHRRLLMDSLKDLKFMVLGLVGRQQNVGPEWTRGSAFAGL